MDFRKLSISNLPSSFNADTIVLDRANSEVIYASIVGYSTMINDALKEIRTPSLHCYVPGAGSYRTVRTGYETEMKRDNMSDYVHAIFFAKDKVNYKEDGTEEIQIFIYSKTEEELVDKLYAKVSKYSSVPVLEEWKTYIKNSLIEANKLRELTIVTSREQRPFSTYRAFFNKNDIKNIVTAGLESGDLNIMGNNNPSPLLNTISGLNDYLAMVGETLAEKIQSSFRPKFIPGKDAYDAFTNNVDDFMYHEADIELFEAQKSVIQAVVNNMKVNDATFVIAEMGSGNYVI